MSNARDLVKATENLFSLPDIYLRLKAVLDDPNSSIVDMIAVIRQDPAMTARLLRMVNSAFFGQAAKIDTVERAVNLLGTQQIHDLALSTTVTEVFANTSNRVISMEEYWHASVRCGVTSRLIAYQCNILDSERLFVAGLLQDIGHLIMYTAIPDKMTEILQQADDGSDNVASLERTQLGFDYSDVGAEMMHAWNFPDSLIEITAFQLEPHKARHYPLETSIVNIARNLEPVMAGSQPIEMAVKAMHPDVWHLTDISADTLSAICTESRQKTSQALDLLFPRSKVVSR